MINTQRYAGKPLLRILECYVLAQIGELGSKEQASLEAMTPRLGQIFGATGTWQEIVEQGMDMKPKLREKIVELWRDYTSQAKQAHEEPSPQTFAEHFADANFDIADAR